MAVYLIIEYTKIEDKSLYLNYIQKAEPIVKKFGGEYIVRIERVKSLSDSRNPERMVIIKFPTEENMNKCFGSTAYKSIASMRMDSTESQAFMVDEYID